MNKLKKALVVVQDLKQLEFKQDPWKLTHPEGKYSIWVANGFWWCALYTVDGKDVDRDFDVCKFGAIGKVLVWWQCSRFIKKVKKEKSADRKQKAKQLLDKVFN